MNPLDSVEKQEDGDFDIEKIQNTPIEELEREDKVRVMFTLLKQLQPFLSANNLTVVTRSGPGNQGVIRNLDQINHSKGSVDNHMKSNMSRKPIKGNFLSNSQMANKGLKNAYEQHMTANLAPHAQQSEDGGPSTLDNMLTNIQVQNKQ